MIPFKAQLPTVASLPLEDHLYYETATHVFLLSSAKTQKRFQIIQFTKDKSRLIYHLVATNESEESAKAKIVKWVTSPNSNGAPCSEITLTSSSASPLGSASQATSLKNPTAGSTTTTPVASSPTSTPVATAIDKKILSQGTACGIIGFVRFLQGYYLILATKKRRVGRIGINVIYEVMDVTLVTLFGESLNTSSFFQRRDDEMRYLELFRSFDLKKNFFFSYTYDLSNALQANMSREEEAAGFLRWKYIWNEFLLEPLLVVRGSSHHDQNTNNDQCDHYDSDMKKNNQHKSSQDKDEREAKGEANTTTTTRIPSVDEENAAEPEEKEGEKEQEKHSQKEKFDEEEEEEVLLKNRIVPNDNVLRPLILYLIRGAVVHAHIYGYARTIPVTIIARSSKHFAGSRYLKRGVNDNGHVANQVEVEQIVCDESSLCEGATRGRFASFVQLRGSVPIKWYHPTTNRPQPSIRLGTTDPFYISTKKHFCELLEDYGAPIVIVNLLKKEERKRREAILSEQYEKAVQYLVQGTSAQQTKEKEAPKKKRDNNGEGKEGGKKMLNLDADEKKREEEEEQRTVGKNNSKTSAAAHHCFCHSTASDCKTSNDGRKVGKKEREEEVVDKKKSSLLTYCHYDLRNSTSAAWNEMTAICEDNVDLTGFFACNTTHAQFQRGVIRANCVDCIDRTNVGQFFLGLHVLGLQLVSVKVLDSHVQMEEAEKVQDLLFKMYIQVGDALAIQYGGSATVGVGLVNRGVGWDSLMGLQRLWNNYWTDGEKQNVINLFLGLYQPCPLEAPGLDQFRVPPWQPPEGIAKFLASKLNSVVPHRVLDIAELESDYYLHVKKLSQSDDFQKMAINVRWYENALKRHQLRFATRRTQNRSGRDGLDKDRQKLQSNCGETLALDAGDDKMVTKEQRDELQEGKREEVEAAVSPYLENADVENVDNDRLSRYLLLRHQLASLSAVVEGGPTTLVPQPVSSTAASQTQNNNTTKQKSIALVDSEDEIDENIAAVQLLMYHAYEAENDEFESFSHYREEQMLASQHRYDCFEKEDMSFLEAQAEYPLGPRYGGKLSSSKTKEYGSTNTNNELVFNPSQYPIEVIHSLYNREKQQRIKAVDYGVYPVDSFYLSCLMALPSPWQWTHSDFKAALKICDFLPRESVNRLEELASRISDGVQHFVSTVTEGEPELQKAKQNLAFSSDEEVKSPLLLSSVSTPGSSLWKTVPGWATVGRRFSFLVRSAISEIDLPFSSPEAQEALRMYNPNTPSDLTVALVDKWELDDQPPVSARQEMLHDMFRNYLTPRVGITPEVIDDVLVRWVNLFSDQQHGVLQRDCLRYVEGESLKNKLVPTSRSVKNAFAAKDLITWVEQHEALLGMKLTRGATGLHSSDTDEEDSHFGQRHHHQKRRFAARMLLQCMLSGSIFHRIHPPTLETGIMVNPITGQEFRDDSSLYRFFHRDERIILNAQSTGRGNLARSMLRRSEMLMQPLQLVEAMVHIALDLFKSEGSHFDKRKTHETLCTHAEQLQDINIENVITNDERHCFFANVFNSLYIHAWFYSQLHPAIEYDVAFKTYVYNVGGYHLSLADIKHAILRQNKAAPRNFLPPFLRGDKRLCLMVERPDPRILLALIDVYHAPEGFYEGSTGDQYDFYSSFVLVEHGTSFGDSATFSSPSPSSPMNNDYFLNRGSRGNSPVAATSPQLKQQGGGNTIPNNNNSSAGIGGGGGGNNNKRKKEKKNSVHQSSTNPQPDSSSSSEDEVPSAVNELARVKTSGVPAAPASLLQRLIYGEKKALPVNPCAVLIPNDLNEQLSKIESEFAGHLPKHVDALCGLEEFGRSKDEALKYFSQGVRGGSNAAGKGKLKKQK